MKFIPKTGGNFTGPVYGYKETPNNDLELATKGYVDEQGGGGGSPAGSDTQIQFNDDGSFGGSADLTWSNGLTINNSQQAISPLRVKTSSQPYALYIASSGRFCINTGTASSDLNIGGTGIVSAFGSANQLRNFNTIQTGSSGAARLTINAGEVHIGGDTGASTLSLRSHNTTGTALGIKQVAGGSTKLVKLVDSSGVETMGLTTLGFTQAGAGNGLARFDMNHTVSPASADGDGVGISLRTENASGTIKDIAFIDTVFTDISAHQAKLSFSLKDDSSSASTPREVMYFNHDGVPVFLNLPTSDPFIVGALYTTTGGNLKVSEG